MNIEQEIKNIKNKYQDDKIEKAKCEGRLEDLEKKKVEIVQRCEDLGIKPEELPQKIQDSTAKLEDLVGKAKALFIPQETVVTVPTTSEAPF